jgi:hypothetical protein
MHLLTPLKETSPAIDVKISVVIHFFVMFQNVFLLVQVKLIPFNRLVAIVLVATAAACVEPYPTPEGASDLSILVVDGFVDGTDGVATVQLTHTTKLNEDSGSPAEKGAIVSIKAETGASYALIEQDPGYTGQTVLLLM